MDPITTEIQRMELKLFQFDVTKTMSFTFLFEKKKKNYLPLCINSYKIITYFLKGREKTAIKTDTLLVHLSSVLVQKTALNPPTYTSGVWPVRRNLSICCL